MTMPTLSSLAGIGTNELLMPEHTRHTNHPSYAVEPPQAGPALVGMNGIDRSIVLDCRP